MNDIPISNCCGVEMLWADECDLCPKCKEHCDAVYPDENGEYPED